MKNLEQPSDDGIFGDDMSEDEILAAFKEASGKVDEDEDTEQPTEDVVEEDSAPEEATEEVVEDEVEQPTEVPPRESNVIDFSQPFIVKNRGINLPINNREEATALMEKGLDYTRKTNELAKHRPIVDYTSQHGITIEDLQLLAEAKAGNKDAIAKLAGDAKIDPYDLNIDEGYKPKQEFAPIVTTEADIVASEILADPELSNSFRATMEYVPESFKNTLGSNADVLRKFSIDIKSGVAQELLPEAIKQHALKGGDFLNHYIESARNMSQKQALQEPVKALKAEPKPVSPNRAKASVTAPSGSSNSTESLWDMDDSDFMEKIRQLS